MPFSPHIMGAHSWAYGQGWAVNAASLCMPAYLVPCSPSPQMYLIPSVSSGSFPADGGETIHTKSQPCSADSKRWILKCNATATVRKFRRHSAGKIHRYKKTQAGNFLTIRVASTVKWEGEFLQAVTQAHFVHQNVMSKSESTPYMELSCATS